MSVHGKGREGGEGSQKSCHGKRVEPCRLVLCSGCDVAKQTADEKTTNQVTGKNPDGEAVQAGVLRDCLDA